MRTQVCITIDTEFSIGGAFADPDARQPIGTPNVEQGLAFLLETFRRHDVTATYFVETLNAHWFDIGEMGRLVERIVDGGHDVQLHLHPCWTVFSDHAWREAVRAAPPNDDCALLTEARLTDLISHGAETLERMGAPRPIAMRTGNLKAERMVYRAMRACGMSVASNVGLALNRPDDPELRLRGGRHRIEGVLEVPVLTYGPGERLFTTTACSWGETEALLRQARGAGVPTVLLLTHPFEFTKGNRLDPTRQRPNRINQKRMEQLCAFIAANPEEFEAVSFADAAPGWLAAPDVPEPRLTAPLPRVVARMIENKANDLVASL